MEILQTWWQAFWGILVESGGWLLLGFGIAGVLHVLVPRSVLVRALGGRGIGPVVRGALIGAPLPLCSCSVIPTAAGLRRSGATRGATASFAVAAPEVNVPAVALTWGMLGPWVAVIRTVTAILIAFGTGLLMDRDAPARKVDGPRGSDSKGRAQIGQPEEAACCKQTGASGEHAGRTVSLQVLQAPATAHPAGQVGFRSERWRGLLLKPVEVVQYALVTLPRSLAGWMLIGLAVAAMVVAIVPEGWAVSEQLPGGLTTQILLALVVGLPLYVCATSSTPLAAAMIAAGFEPGAALVFLIAGPATNPATIAWVIQDFGARGALLYTCSIAAGASAAGFLLNPILAAHMRLVTQAVLLEHQASGLQGALAGVLLALLVLAMLDSIFGRLATKPQADSCCSPAQSAPSLSEAP